MTSRIITSALTVIGAYAVIKYAYTKGEEKGKAVILEYFKNECPNVFERVMEEPTKND